MEDKKVIITGKVMFKRSDSDSCVCCNGKHVFCQYVNWIPSEEVHTCFENDFVQGVIHKFIGNKENKTIKITIEEVEANK